jgi:hypothetical protein
MLIGHRFERTAQGDLHIHSRNRVQSAFVLLTGAMAFILPLAFVVFGFSAENASLADLDPLSSLLIVLGLLLIPALGLLLMVYTGTRETLLLSRHSGEGTRRTRNFFGRRERVQSVFSINAPPCPRTSPPPTGRAGLYPAVAGDARWQRAAFDHRQRAGGAGQSTHRQVAA